MWFAGKVEIVEIYKDRTIRTVDEIFHIPAIVRFIGNVIKKFEFNLLQKVIKTQIIKMKQRLFNI